MTAKFLHNYPARNARRIMLQSRKFFIVTCVLELLGIPMMIFFSMLHEYAEGLEQYSSFRNSFGNVWQYELIGGFCLGIAVLMGMFCGIRAYEEEWNKSHVDMLYALPLSGKQRFFSDYAGGLIMYLLPYIAAVLIGWIILLIMSPIVLSVNEVYRVNDTFSEIYKYYFLLTLGLGVLMWMYFSISALAASCCGTLFENIYTNLLLNLLIPGTFAAVLSYIINEVDGLDFEYSWQFIGYTSPIGGLIYLFYLISEFDSDFSYHSNSIRYISAGIRGESGLIPAYLRWIFVIILLTIAITVLAWRLYEHRKAEQVGKTFVYTWIYHVILTAVMVCILCLFDLDETAVPVLIFSAIVYFIMDVIRKRGFRAFWKSVIAYIATVSITLATFYITIRTDCFGRTKYVPPAMTVSSAEIIFDDAISDDYLTFDLIYSDKDTLSKLEDFHKDYIQNHDSRVEEIKNIRKEYHYTRDYDVFSSNAFDDYYSDDYYQDDEEYVYINYSSFTITYHTLIGTSIHRSYSLLNDEFLDLMQICSGTDLYAEAWGSLINRRLERNAKNEKDQFVSVMKLSVTYPFTYLTTDINIPDPKTNISVLAQAYQEDMKNMTFEQYCKDEIICWLDEIPVFASNAQTLNLLGQWGFSQTNDMAQNIINQARQYDTYNSKTNAGIAIYAPEDYRTNAQKYPSNSLDDIYFKKNDSHFAYLDAIPADMTIPEIKNKLPELYEVLNHAKRHYISTENCYLLSVGGEYYFIPEEDSTLVEKLIARDRTLMIFPDPPIPSGTKA